MPRLAAPPTSNRSTVRRCSGSQCRTPRMIVSAMIFIPFLLLISRNNVCKNIIAASCFSAHADDAHHPAVLMVEDVAMEHPVAGIVGDERDLGALARRNKHGVAPR